MSTVNTMMPWQWVVLAVLLPAIVLLYFLKLRRQSLEVPSTLLWRTSLEEHRVNALWQRLRANVVLALQLLLVALLMLVLLRPGMSGARLVGDRFLFLIDTSASMSATDVRPSRLEAAKRRVAELIEGMDAGDTAMIVSFSDSAHVEQLFTDDRRQLQRSLGAIEPTNRRTRLDEALRVATALAQGDRAEDASPATVYIVSDGKFADVDDFSNAQLTPIFLPVGQSEAPNVGITALGVRRGEDSGERLQAFARLENFGPQAVSAEMELERDGVLFDSRHVKLVPQGAESIIFDLGDMPSGIVKLVTRTGGALALDDQAWATIEPVVRPRVLVVTPGNDALVTALGTERARQSAEVEIVEPDVLATQDYQLRAAAGEFALVIYDRCRPAEMPQSNTLFIGRAPPAGPWQIAANLAAPRIVDVETAHPLVHLIDLGDVRFGEGAAVSPPPGGTALVSTDAGPLLAIGPRGRFEDVVLGAELVGVDASGRSYNNTDWPLRLSFPLFMMNALSYLAQHGTTAADAVEPGQSVSLASTGPSGTVSIRTPSGRSITQERPAGKGFDFTATDELGVYTVEQAGHPPRRFAVNLLDRTESDITPRAGIQVGQEKIEGPAAWQGARTELWKTLLLGVLGVLCLEWYIYNRRIYL